MRKNNKKYIEAINNLKKLYKNIDNIAKDASEYICDYIEYDYNNIIKNQIDIYYNDYHPRYYKRTKSLYKAYRIINNGSEIGVDFDSKYMPHTHRVDEKDENYIFHWMFERGYHGGARPKNGRFISELNYKKGNSNLNAFHASMLYRTPTPQAIAAGFASGKPYQRWSKYPVAVAQTPPLKAINEDLDEYDKKKLKNRVRQGLETAFFKYDIII